MEVQLHVDVRMRQKAGTETTKIKSAKSFVEVHPRKFIPSKYTRYTVLTDLAIKERTSCLRRIVSKSHIQYRFSTLNHTYEYM